jgi:hypothetical protein
VTKRDSRDAWAGIVNLDEGPPASKPSTDGELSSTITNANVDTDVDPLANLERVPSERMKTLETPQGFTNQAHEKNEGPRTPRRPIGVRKTPITEKRAPKNVTRPNKRDAPPIQLPVPEDMTPNKPTASFSNHDSLDELHEIRETVWEPQVTASWHEYRQVIGIVFAGLVVICLFLVFDRDDDKNEGAEPTPTEANKSVANKRLERIRKSRAGQLPQGGEPNSKVQDNTRPDQQPSPRPVQTRRPPPEEPAEPPDDKETQKVVIPMLSILSIPLGALVEIDGKMYGKTPLIRLSPVKAGPMQVKLRFKHHKTLSSVIQPNENGHYEAKLVMEPK